jgi:hypothetical protein
MVVSTQIDPVFEKILCFGDYAFVVRTSLPLFEDGFFPLCYLHNKPMGVWEGVAMDFLKYHSGSSCTTHLCSAGGPPLKRPYSNFRGGLWPSSTPLDTLCRML